jgi:hypothetical protein
MRATVRGRWWWTMRTMTDPIATATDLSLSAYLPLSPIGSIVTKSRSQEVVKRLHEIQRQYLVGSDALTEFVGLASPCLLHTTGFSRCRSNWDEFRKVYGFEPSFLRTSPSPLPTLYENALRRLLIGRFLGRRMSFMSHRGWKDFFNTERCPLHRYTNTNIDLLRP